MSTQELAGLEKARKAYAANVSPRSRTLALLESEVDGTRFDGRHSWFSGEGTIFDRKPAIVYHVVESSIQSKVDLMLGEGRFPTITSGPDEDEDEDEAEDGLGEEESKAIDRLICSFVKEAKLAMLWREMYQSAQGCGTAPALLGVRKSRLFAETLPAKWATRTLDAEQNLVAVTIQYPYLENKKINGVWTATCMLYKRVIDAQRDVTYAPAEADIDGIEPLWKEQTVAVHGLGFVPVLWYRHHAPMQNLAGDDGFAVHRTLLDQLEGIDMALSQRHTGALGSLPQIVEIGVEPGYNPTADAPQGMSVQVTMTGGTPGHNNPVRGEYRTQPSDGTQGARKKGPGSVWQYASPDTKVEAINTPGEAMQALDAHIKDLKSKICETLAYVPLDPESIRYAATVSGKALEILRARELNRISRDREAFGDEIILGTVDMLLRIALQLGAALKTPRLKKALPILAQFMVTETVPGDALGTTKSVRSWQPPSLTLKWPEFFKPNAEDEARVVELAGKAYENGSITRRTQVEAQKRIFGIGNIDAYLEALEEEQEERDAKAAAELESSIANVHGQLNGTAGKRTGEGLEGEDSQNGGGGANAATRSPKANGKGPGKPGANRRA
jgi:hypothetical protein